MGSDEAFEDRRQGGPTGVRSGRYLRVFAFITQQGALGPPSPPSVSTIPQDSFALGPHGERGRLGAANGKGTDSRPGQARLELGVSPPRGSGGRGLTPLKPRVTSHAGWPARGPPLSIGGQVSLGTWLTAHVGGLNLQPLQPQGPENPIVSPDSGLTQRPVNKDALLSGVSQGLRASPRSWAGQSLVGPVGCGQPRAAELTLYCRGGCLQTNGGGGASRWEPGLGGKTCPRVLSSPLAPAATVLPPRLSPGPELPQGPVPRQSPRTGPLSLCTEPPPEPSALEEALVPAPAEVPRGDNVREPPRRMRCAV